MADQTNGNNKNSILVPVIVALIAATATIVAGYFTLLAGTSPPPQDRFAIALINNHCIDQDYYVDGKLVASVTADSETTFITTRGIHWVRACHAGTNTCGGLNQVTWLSATERHIGRGKDCPVTITLINDHCSAQDYYVDNELVVTIGANLEKAFDIEPGEHQVKACYPETSRCSEIGQVNWTTSAERRIARGRDCPITVTVINEHCNPQDYFVDGKLITSLEAGEKTSFKTEIGEHEVTACFPGTKNCSKENKVYFSEDTTRTIGRGSTCD